MLSVAAKETNRMAQIYQNGGFRKCYRQRNVVVFRTGSCCAKFLIIYLLTCIGPQQYFQALLLETHKGHEYINEIDDFAPVNVPPRPQSLQLVDHYIDSKGVARVKGNKNLKSSQSYPKMFQSKNWYIWYLTFSYVVSLLHPKSSYWFQLVSLMWALDGSLPENKTSRSQGLGRPWQD